MILLQDYGDIHGDKHCHGGDSSQKAEGTKESHGIVKLEGTEQEAIAKLERVFKFSVFSYKL